MPDSLRRKRSICSAKPATVGNSNNLRSGNVDVKAAPQAGDHARGEQRMTAEVEEIIVDADLVEL